MQAMSITVLCQDCKQWPFAEGARPIQAEVVNLVNKCLTTSSKDATNNKGIATSSFLLLVAVCP